MRSITSHSTAFFNSTLSTARMLLTVFAAFVLPGDLCAQFAAAEA